MDAFLASNSSQEALVHFIGWFFLFELITCTIILQVNTVAKTMIFLKSGKNGWASLIPIYNDYVMFDIATGKGFLGIMGIILPSVGLFIYKVYSNTNLVLFGALILLLFSLTGFVLVAFMKFKLAQKFGHGIIFWLGLLLMPIVFYCILAFGQSKYQTKVDVSKKNETEPFR